MLFFAKHDLYRVARPRREDRVEPGPGEERRGDESLVDLGARIGGPQRVRPRVQAREQHARPEDECDGERDPADRREVVEERLGGAQEAIDVGAQIPRGHVHKLVGCSGSPWPSRRASPGGSRTSSADSRRDASRPSRCFSSASQPGWSPFSFALAIGADRLSTDDFLLARRRRGRAGARAGDLLQGDGARLDWSARRSARSGSWSSPSVSLTRRPELQTVGGGDRIPAVMAVAHDPDRTGGRRVVDVISAAVRRSASGSSSRSLTPPRRAIRHGRSRR